MAQGYAAVFNLVSFCRDEGASSEEKIKIPFSTIGPAQLMTPRELASPCEARLNRVLPSETVFFSSAGAISTVAAKFSKATRFQINYPVAGAGHAMQLDPLEARAAKLS